MIDPQQSTEPRFAVLPPRETAVSVAAATPAGGADDPAEGGFQPFGADGFTFSDFLDVINPLQHIPVISTLYRQWTGDRIDPGARVVGDTLYGGPVGLFSGIVNAVVEHETGSDVGQHVLALFDGEQAPQDAPVAVAALPQAVAQAVPQPRSISAMATSFMPPDAVEASIADATADVIVDDRTVQFGAPGAMPFDTPVATRPEVAAIPIALPRPLIRWDAGLVEGPPAGAQADGVSPTRPEDARAVDAGAPPAPGAMGLALLTTQSDANAGVGPWFSAGMARGLDKYHEMTAAAAAPPRQLDARY